MKKIKQMLEAVTLAYQAYEKLQELKKPYEINTYFQFNCPLLDITIYHKNKEGDTDKVYTAQIFWENEVYHGRLDAKQNKYFKCDMTVAIENVTADLTWISKYGDAGSLENNPLWDLHVVKEEK